MIKVNKYIIIHHTKVSTEKNKEQFNAVEKYHVSKGWGQIGYNYFIEPGGQMKIGRSEDDPGAHCTQKFMNFRSVGICLAGDFDIEEPTIEQLETLQKLVDSIMKKNNILPKNVLGHRKLATYKSCPGTNLTDRMIEDIANGKCVTSPISEWAEDAVKWCKKEGIATNWDFPQAKITREEMATMLHRFFIYID